MKKIALIMFLFVSGAHSQSLLKLNKEVRSSIVSIDIVTFDCLVSAKVNFKR